jgi:polar amino acid transport system substrate-binding protein
MIRRTFIMAATLATSLAAGTAQAQDTLKVGTEANGLPFSFVDPATNAPDGFMVDVIKMIAQQEDLTITIEPMEFSALISSLTSGKVDMTSAAMYVTEERKKVIDFSEPVFGYGEGMVVKSDDDTAYTAFTELSGETVGAQLGTMYVAPLQDASVFREVKVYDTVQNMMQDVAQGRTKAGFADAPIMAHFLAKGQFSNLKLVPTYQPVVPGEIAVAVPKGNADLLAKVNDGIAKIKASGELDELVQKWNLR